MKSLVLIGLLVSTLVSVAEAQSPRRPYPGQPVPPPQPVSYEEMFQYIQVPPPRYRANGDLSCACNELERRVNGLQLVVNAYAQAGVTEAQFPELRNLNFAIQKGRQGLNYAQGRSYEQQQDGCGSGSNIVDPSWQKWQPKLGARGLDSDYYTGVRAARQGAPVNGDPECDPGFFTVRRDGAEWAAAANIGICSLETGVAEIKFWHNRRAAEEGLPESEKKKCYYTYEYKRP